MKKIALLTMACIVSLCAMSQDNNGTNNPIKMKSDNYCAMLIDSGSVVVLQSGKEIKEDVILANGTTVKTTGIVIKKDGSQFALKNGDCVDSSGNLVKANGQIDDHKTDQTVPPEK